MRFTAIDFETANNSLLSGCAIGIVVIEEGVVVHKQSLYITPPREYCYFLPMNSKINRLSLDIIQSAPHWDEVRKQIEPWLIDTIIVAHNAQFDVSILCALDNYYGIKSEYEYLCTVQLSRKLYSELDNHRLDTVCQFIDVELNHHDPLSDAYGCSMIIIDAMNMLNTMDLRKIAQLTGTKIKIRGN